MFAYLQKYKKYFKIGLADFDDFNNIQSCPASSIQDIYDKKKSDWPPFWEFAIQQRLSENVINLVLDQTKNTIFKSWKIVNGLWGELYFESHLDSR